MSSEPKLDTTFCSLWMRIWTQSTSLSKDPQPHFINKSGKIFLPFMSTWLARRIRHLLYFMTSLLLAQMFLKGMFVCLFICFLPKKTFSDVNREFWWSQMEKEVCASGFKLLLLLGSETSPQRFMIWMLGTQTVKPLGGGVCLKAIRHERQFPKAGLHSLLPVYHDVGCQQHRLPPSHTESSLSAFLVTRDLHLFQTWSQNISLNVSAPARYLSHSNINTA